MNLNDLDTKNLKNDIHIEYNGSSFLTDEWMGKRMEAGNYEVEELKLLNNIIDNKLTVLELGGCLGVVSVILNKKLKDPSKHLVIEANPNLIKYLEYNKEINNCSFKIKNGLVSTSSDGIFYSYDKLVAGSAHRLDNRETNKTKHTVPVFSLDQLQEEVGYNFNFLVIDIEGGELEFFQSFNCTGFKYILLEVHEGLMYSGFNNEVFKILTDNNFKIIQSLGNCILLKNDSYSSNSFGVERDTK